MAKHGTYLQRLENGRYEYGRLIEQVEYLGGYHGALANCREWKILPPKRVPHGTVETCDLARSWMTLLENDR